MINKLISTLRYSFLGICVFFTSIQANPFNSLKDLAFNVPTFQDLFLDKKLNAAGILKENGLYKDLRLVSLEQFESTLDQFLTVMHDQLKDSHKWLDGNNSITTKKGTFLPYAQKLVKGHSKRCLLKGDLHGDIHSPIAAIELMQTLGITSAENPLKINDPSFQLIFLGDYVDRGLWGTEVIYLLMLLKITNPDQVILIRGNHEDPQITSLYGFDYEFNAKFADSSSIDRKRCYKKICAFYNTLPAVLYLGSGNDTRKNFVQCCHGGLEIGYNPKQLLASPDTIEYARIYSLNRATESKKLPTLPVNHSTLQHYCCSDFKPTTPIDLGFLWNDFIVDPQETSTYNAKRGFAFNKALTDAILEAASTDSVRLIGAIRAHQHCPSNTDPLMALMLKSKGCASLWHDQKEDVRFTQGTVLTLLLSPDTLYGQPNEYYSGFTYDTSLLLTTGNSLEEWHATVINNDVYAHHQNKGIVSNEETLDGLAYTYYKKITGLLYAFTELVNKKFLEGVEYGSSFLKN